MRDRDLLLLGFVGLGAYVLLKKESDKFTSTIDSIAVPLIYTGGQVNSAINNANSTFTATYTGLNDITKQVNSGLMTYLDIMTLNPIKIIQGLFKW